MVGCLLRGLAPRFKSVADVPSAAASPRGQMPQLRVRSPRQHRALPGMWHNHSVEVACMKRRFSRFALALSPVLCMATAALWIMPSSEWSNHGRRTFFFSVDKHQFLQMHIFRASASPVVSPPQENIRAFVRWQVAIPSGALFDFLGFRVDHYPWFKGSRSADGHNFLTHVRTRWSVAVPFLGLFLLFALPWVVKVSAWAGRRLRRSPRAGCCINCKYNLTGNTSGMCPECGTPIPSPVGAI